MPSLDTVDVDAAPSMSEGILSEVNDYEESDSSSDGTQDWCLDERDDERERGEDVWAAGGECHHGQISEDEVNE